MLLDFIVKIFCYKHTSTFFCFTDLFYPPPKIHSCIVFLCRFIIIILLMDAALIPSSNEIEIDCFLFRNHFVSLCNKCMRIEF